ncbi:MAG: hypothetical protein AB1567_06720 [bacterium]
MGIKDTILILLLLAILTGGIIWQDRQIKKLFDEHTELQKKLLIASGYKILPVVVTCYNAEKRQTDSTPTISSGRRYGGK